jgi:hypothetical protein
MGAAPIWTLHRTLVCVMAHSLHCLSVKIWAQSIPFVLGIHNILFVFTCLNYNYLFMRVKAQKHCETPRLYITLLSVSDTGSCFLPLRKFSLIPYPEGCWAVLLLSPPSCDYYHYLIIVYGNACSALEQLRFWFEHRPICSGNVQLERSGSSERFSAGNWYPTSWQLPQAVTWPRGSESPASGS